MDQSPEAALVKRIGRHCPINKGAYYLAYCIKKIDLNLLPEWQNPKPWVIVRRASDFRTLTIVAKDEAGHY
jgi:hypothetical protein